MEAASLRNRLRTAVRETPDRASGLWAWLRAQVDPAQQMPQAAGEVVDRRLTGREGEYHVLKNPACRTYYRLSDRDHFLWRLMDGTQTVKDLVVAYFLQYGSFAFARVSTLVDGLKANLFLQQQPVNVYGHLRDRLLNRRLSHRLNQVWQAFLERQFAINGLDGALSRAYRYVGWALYSRPALVAYAIVSAIGLCLFARLFSTAEYDVVSIGGSYVLGVIGLIVANLAGILAHEMAHALTVKHYGREVRRGGFMIYFGMPAFFVDTTDIWLEDKGPRLAVTWAGPYSGLILGGLAAIIMTLWPSPSFNPLLFQFAFLSYLTVFLNLNPLLELDGYFLLMDWLEIPMLRDKSLQFLRTGLSGKLRALRRDHEGWRSLVASLSREERIFGVFGLLSALWTVYAIFTAAQFYQEQLASALGSLWASGGGVAKVLLAVGGLAITLPFILSLGMYALGLGRQLWDWAARRGFLDNLWRVAGVSLVITAAVAFAPARCGLGALSPWTELAGLIPALFFALRGAQAYSGARMAWVFTLLALFSLGLLVSDLMCWAPWSTATSRELLPPVATAARCLGYCALLAAGAVAFVDSNLRDLLSVEKALLALGLVSNCGLLAILSRTLQPNAPAAPALVIAVGALVPLLTLTLWIPSLVGFWHTGSGPAWAMLSLSLMSLLAATMWQLQMTLPYLLLATALVLHHAAYGRAGLVGGALEPSLAASDQRRLQRAFGWTAGAVAGQLREVAGDRRSSALVHRFNAYALAAGWRIQIAENRLQDSLPRKWTVIRRGEVYAGALALLLDMVAQVAGEKLTARALQLAYDGLPWEEREIAAQYLFRSVNRAATLSREFHATRHDYQGLLRRMPLFATMDEGEITLLCSRLTTEHYAAGRTIIRQGDKGDRFFIISQGHVEVTQRDANGVSEVVGQLDRGDYFGELALLHDAPRNATCRATVPTTVLSLSQHDFQHLVKARFALRDKVDRHIAWVELLRRIPLFAELDAQQIQLIAAQLREQTFERGAVIMRQGEVGETFCVIEKGRVQVSVIHEGRKKVIAERGTGEYVGEIALLLKVPRTATVTALTAVRLLALHKADFERLVATHLYVSRGLEQETSRRMIGLRRAGASA